MTAPEELHPNCNMCAAKKRDEEAAAGLRCSSCLESFDQPWLVQSEESPSLCKSCARIAMAPKFPPHVRYGYTVPKKRGTT